MPSTVDPEGDTTLTLKKYTVYPTDTGGKKLLICPNVAAGVGGGPSLVAPLVKNLPGMQETRVRSVSQEYPLENEMAAHSSILAWRIPGTEEPGGLQSMVSQSWTQLSDYHHYQQ